MRLVERMNGVLEYVQDENETPENQEFLKKITDYRIQRHGASIYFFAKGDDKHVLYCNTFDNTSFINDPRGYALAAEFGAKRFLIGKAHSSLTEEQAREQKVIQYERDLSFPLKVSEEEHVTSFKAVTLTELLAINKKNQNKLYEDFAELFNRCADFTPGKQNEYLTGGKKADKFCRFNLDNHQLFASTITDQAFLLDKENKIIGTISATIIFQPDGTIHVYWLDEIVDYFTRLQPKEKEALEKLYKNEEQLSEKAQKAEIAKIIEPRRLELMRPLFAAAQKQIIQTISSLSGSSGESLIKADKVHSFIRAAAGRVPSYEALACGEEKSTTYVIHGPPTKYIEMLDHHVKNWADQQLLKGIVQNITRFQVHVIAHTQSDKLEKTIQRLRELIDKNEAEHNSEYKENLKAVSVYYAFYKRDKDLALTYLTKYQIVCETAQEKVEALSLIAYVRTIDPNFVDEDNLFSQVLRNLDELPEADKDTDGEVTRAFAKQYQAMITHRRACFKKTTNNNIEHALTLIDEAIAIQENQLPTCPSLKIGLAESKHLKAVMLYRLANLEKDEKERQQKFIETETLFTQAAQLEEAFCQETQAPHFLIATTLQSLARVLKSMGRSSETHAHYRRALEMQESIFGKGPHEDIAKTWHFWAETFVQERNYAGALDAFLNALLIKYKTNSANSNITKETEVALMAALENFEKQDSQLALEKCNQIHTALTDKGNRNEFKNKDTAFVELISAKLIKLKPVSPLRSCSLYTAGPYSDTRSKMVEASQPASATPALQRSSCQNLSLRR